VYFCGGKVRKIVHQNRCKHGGGRRGIPRKKEQKKARRRKRLYMEREFFHGKITFSREARGF
jgi:hypothetical protein